MIASMSSSGPQTTMSPLTRLRDEFRRKLQAERDGIIRRIVAAKKVLREEAELQQRSVGYRERDATDSLIGSPKIAQQLSNQNRRRRRVVGYGDDSNSYHSSSPQQHGGFSASPPPNTRAKSQVLSVREQFRLRRQSSTTGSRSAGDASRRQPAINPHDALPPIGGSRRGSDDEGEGTSAPSSGSPLVHNDRYHKANKKKKASLSAPPAGRRNSHQMDHQHHHDDHLGLEQEQEQQQQQQQQHVAPHPPTQPQPPVLSKKQQKKLQEHAARKAREEDRKRQMEARKKKRDEIHRKRLEEKERRQREQQEEEQQQQAQPPPQGSSSPQLHHQQQQQYRDILRSRETTISIGDRVIFKPEDDFVAGPHGAGNESDMSDMESPTSATPVSTSDHNQHQQKPDLIRFTSDNNHSNNSLVASESSSRAGPPTPLTAEGQGLNLETGQVEINVSPDNLENERVAAPTPQEATQQGLHPRTGAILHPSRSNNHASRAGNPSPYTPAPGTQLDEEPTATSAVPPPEAGTPDTEVDGPSPTFLDELEGQVCTVERLSKDLLLCLKDAEVMIGTSDDLSEDTPRLKAVIEESEEIESQILAVDAKLVTARTMLSSLVAQYKGEDMNDIEQVQTDAFQVLSTVQPVLVGLRDMRGDVNSQMESVMAKQRQRQQQKTPAAVVPRPPSAPKSSPSTLRRPSATRKKQQQQQPQQPQPQQPQPPQSAGSRQHQQRQKSAQKKPAAAAVADPDSRPVAAASPQPGGGGGELNVYEQAALQAEAAAPTQAIKLSPCSICNRKFAVDRLPKHEAACAKSAASKRKKFDPKKARLQGTEAAQFAKHADQTEKEYKKKAPPKTNWRAKSEAFRAAMRAAKDPNAAPAPAIERTDLVPCPVCGRKFNDTAAKKHIPRCQEQASRPKPTAKGRARVKYDPRKR